MSKICKSCGNYYEGDYCTKCGYGNKNLKVKAAEKYKKATKPERFMTDQEKKEYYALQQKKNQEKTAKSKEKSHKNLLIFVSIVAIAVIIIGLISSGVFSKEEKTDVIYDYFNAINERDFNAFIDCFPSEIKKDYKNDRETLDYSKTEYMDKFAEEFENEYGSGFSINVTCGKEKLLENYSMTDYEAQYGSVPNISEVYIVSVIVEITGPEKTEESHMECYVGSVNGSWKLFNISEVAGTITEEDISAVS